MRRFRWGWGGWDAGGRADSEFLRTDFYFFEVVVWRVSRSGSGFGVCLDSEVWLGDGLALLRFARNAKTQYGPFLRGGTHL